MKKIITKSFLLILAFTVYIVSPTNQALADGTETLGPPSISIATGSGIIAAGTGMAEVTTGTIDINVPGNVVQALLYWEGQMATDVLGDKTIVIDGTEITGDPVGGIGGPAYFFSGAYSSAFRAEITGMVSSGPNSFLIEGLDDFTKVANGAGILVIYDDGSTAEIGIVDGLDLAFINFPEPRKSTIPQTFNFTPASYERTGMLSMFFSSVAGTISGSDADRPSSIEVTVGGLTTPFSNELASLDGEEWDTVNLPTFNIPAGADSLTVQAFSRDDLGTGNNPASLAWIAAGLSVAPPFCGDLIVEPPETCDPPGETAGDYDNICRDDCTVCGDGILDRNWNEQCDGQAGNCLGECQADCTCAPVCGDEEINAPGETCDPPGRPAGDYGNDCRDDCTVCGDGILDENWDEQCDGNDSEACPDMCQDDCTCRMLAITRTLGYWKNHPTVIDGSFGGDEPDSFQTLLPLTFCGEAIEEPCDAVYFLRKGGGGINCFMRQGMAALLNCTAFGCSTDISDLIATGSEACGEGEEFGFGDACYDLDQYNMSGDDLDLPFKSPSAMPFYCLVEKIKKGKKNKK